MNKSFEKFMKSQCEDCAFEFMDDAEYCTECSLRFKAAYTAGLLRAAEICKSKHENMDSKLNYIAGWLDAEAAIRKEAGDE